MGRLGILNIENHVRGTRCVISGQIIVSWYIHDVWYSQPASEEHPHYSQPATEERRLYGAIRHIEHWRPCQGDLMFYFGTNMPFLIHASYVIPPTGHWGTPHYSQPATEEWMHLAPLCGKWNTSNIENHLGGPTCVIFEHIIQTRCLLIGDTPNRPVRNAHYSQSATEERRLYGAIGHIQHWEPCLGDQMCYFGTNNRLLIYPWCVILPTGQWGTHHHSQPAAEEWMHFKEI